MAKAKASATVQPLQPPSQAQIEPQQRWEKTWSDFNIALRSPTDPFNPFVWIYRLSFAGLDFVYYQSGLNGVVEKYQLHKIWAPLVPLFALCLIFFVLALYFVSIRKMILLRWCKMEDIIVTSSMGCTSIRFHDCIVVYFGAMILYFYFKTNLSSPGVALSSTDSYDIWTCMDQRGGFFGSWGYPKLDVGAERARVALYEPSDLELKEETPKKRDTTKLEPSIDTKETSLNIFPCPDTSFCQKCNITRPPRCHHCQVCNRCILQFDHHCLWVNNCIGYNNYRPFVCLLVHITLGCWYGLSVMMVPFYELIRREQERQAAEPSGTFANEDKNEWGLPEKIYVFYHQSQFFKDTPSNPWALIRMVRSIHGMPWTAGVKIAYPLLLGIGVVMTLFLGFHLKYISKARTTLEHKIILETLCTSLWDMSDSSSPSVLHASGELPYNPFDQGLRKNVRQVLGPNLFHVLLPIHSRPPPPYLPEEGLSHRAKQKIQ